MMSKCKSSGAQRRKLQNEKYDEHNDVIKKAKKLDGLFNV